MLDNQADLDIILNMENINKYSLSAQEAIMVSFINIYSSPMLMPIAYRNWFLDLENPILDFAHDHLRQSILPEFRLTPKDF